MCSPLIQTNPPNRTLCDNKARTPPIRRSHGSSSTRRSTQQEWPGRLSKMREVLWTGSHGCYGITRNHYN
eukprot:3423783-Rhodomonas_salina.1